MPQAPCTRWEVHTRKGTGSVQPRFGIQPTSRVNITTRALLDPLQALNPCTRDSWEHTYTFIQDVPSDHHHHDDRPMSRAAVLDASLRCPHPPAHAPHPTPHACPASPLPPMIAASFAPLPPQDHHVRAPGRHDHPAPSPTLRACLITTIIPATLPPTPPQIITFKPQPGLTPEMALFYQSGSFPQYVNLNGKVCCW